MSLPAAIERPAVLAAAEPRPTVAFCANTLRYLWNFRRSTLQRFLDRGARVVCLGQADETEARLREMGCEPVGLAWRLRSLDPVHEASVVARIFGTLAAHRPAVVFAFTFKANFAVSLACGALRVPYVTNVSGLGTAFLETTPVHRALRRLYGFANGGAWRTFFQNESDLALFTQSGLCSAARSQVLPGSGVDTEHFRAEPLDRPVRTFVLVARLLKDKGVAEYLAAARRARAARPELRFLLAGPEEPEATGGVPMAAVRGCEAVEYLGPLDDVRPVLAAADCLVLPSYREGMPRTVLEAASMGRIAVVSDVEGCRHAVAPGVTGVLCRARCAESLAEAMLTVADYDVGKVAAMSAAARAHAVSRFSEELCIAPYLAAYDEITGAGAPVGR